MRFADRQNNAEIVNRPFTPLTKAPAQSITAVARCGGRTI